MENQIKYEETNGFRKDFKRLVKKYRTLKEDLEVVKSNTIELYHLKGIENQSIFPIPGFCNESLQICKIKKFACKALKGRGAMSGIRVIYAFHLSSHVVEFIEIYFKGEQVNENKERINDYLKK
ncbi:MAG: hypothetical protein WC938_00075 [Candidatus Paceibacterota bacterium]|jgi:hypothetical protein